MKPTFSKAKFFIQSLTWTGIGHPKNMTCVGNCLNPQIIINNMQVDAWVENWVRKKDVAHSYKVVPYYQLEMEWNKSYKFMTEHNFVFTGVSKILLMGLIPPIIHPRSLT